MQTCFISIVQKNYISPEQSSKPQETISKMWTILKEQLLM